ncbi:hypothetical protein MUU53_04455 [Rhizobium lemnae]|uniref:Acyl carrier protein n=1 Tax=Rhizobium lemnae TaxID=1214924 RepID=A0ABV8EAK3_9HYPH|nr:hypothetical protein [Rhizobium lemnae]MCJ8507159.1 hypothetical protein [Rhizobium lemnae]
MNSTFSTMVIEAIKRQNPYLDQPVDFTLGDSAPLYTDGGPLDSLSLITVIADVEQQILKSLGRRIQIASERDLSITMSPFATLGNMVAFITQRYASACAAQKSVA